MPPEIVGKTTKISPQLHIMRKHPLPLAKQGINKQGCPLCGCIISLYDHHHDENLCPRCGCVLNKMVKLNVDYEQMNQFKVYTGSGYTKTEKQVLKRHKHHFKTQKDRRIMRYSSLIKLFTSQLQMIHTDRLEVYYLLRAVHTLKYFHSKLPYETILLGICRYVLKQRGGYPYRLRFKNPLYIEYGLDKKGYNTIEKNIMRLKKNEATMDTISSKKTSTSIRMA